VCSLCRRKEIRRRLRGPELPEGVFAMEAGFDSRCSCGGFINQGERIFRLAEDDPFVCESCALEAI
jgi:hypothetical protein